MISVFLLPTPTTRTSTTYSKEMMDLKHVPTTVGGDSNPANLCAGFSATTPKTSCGGVRLIVEASKGDNKEEDKEDGQWRNLKSRNTPEQDEKRWQF